MRPKGALENIQIKLLEAHIALGKYSLIETLTLALGVFQVRA